MPTSRLRRNGQLAQLVEQRTENPRVRGSIPRLATNIKAPEHSGAFLLPDQS